MQAVDTGRVLWDECFGQNADALYAKIPADNLLKQTLVFHADPNLSALYLSVYPIAVVGSRWALLGHWQLA
jgi:hypothetical protein